MSDMSRELTVLLDEVVGLLPSAFQYPASTRVRLIIDGKRWKTPGFAKNEYSLSEPLFINEERRGSLCVVVDSGLVVGDQPPFSKNERHLLAAAAQHVAIMVAKKEARRARQVLEQQLRQADRLAKIGQFSAGVAHEINEPLANILGFAQLARQHPGLPEQVKSDLDSIVDSSLHAREVIRKLMFFSRQMPPQMLAIDLNEVVEQALAITESGARKANIMLVCEFDDSLPLLLADPQHLKQVVVNLASNAIQAMEEGGGTLTVRTEHKDDIYLIVEDTGPGMPTEVLKQIFSPFYTTKDVDKGTGLGLSVVHGIVKAHDGFIQVESTPGQGTRVEIAFPCQPRPGGDR